MRQVAPQGQWQRRGLMTMPAQMAATRATAPVAIDYAKPSSFDMTWEGDVLHVEIAPPPRWIQLLPPVAGLLLLPLPVVALMALGAMPLVEWGMLIGFVSPLLLIALIAVIQGIRSIVRITHLGLFPIDIEAAPDGLTITCPGQWGNRPRRWAASELRRLEVYKSTRHLDGSHMYYLRVWASDYFHLQELRFTARDGGLAERLDRALHKALRLPRPGHARCCP